VLVLVAADGDGVGCGWWRDRREHLSSQAEVATRQSPAGVSSWHGFQGRHWRRWWEIQVIGRKARKCSSVRRGSPFHCVCCKTHSRPMWAVMSKMRNMQFNMHRNTNHKLGTSKCVPVLLTLTTWHCPHSPATRAAVDRYLLPAGLQQQFCVVGFLNNHFTAQFTTESSCERILKIGWRLRPWDLVAVFLVHPVYVRLPVWLCC